jgi:TRAP-type mannitol/chloroaromatic compound transport system permease small subunit
LTTYIDKWIQKIGIASSYLNLVLITLIFVDVLMRYAFNFSQTWIIELEWYLFSIIFLLGISYTLQTDGHVRVDVFYIKWSDKTRKVVNILGHLMLLIPWCLIAIAKSYTTFINSWHFKEGSPDPGGMPGRYIIKAFIVICFVLLLLQGLSELYKLLIKKAE